MIDIIGAFITLIGAIFLLLGSIGLIRMPDVFTRIQAGTKASTLGTILTLLGIGIIHSEVLGKFFLLIVFILITNPISSHLLARAAHFTKVKKSELTVIDRLSLDQDDINESDTLNQQEL
ncbi:MAG: monovalent cation/H(+) antiporter subunit G [Bacteroidetes bacterium]|nr:monovalent cation/H(+) antiporter subunit G [Bacteroidota bacterium]